jgi:cold shock protein
MENGTVKKITENGFGFILPDGAEKDIFFHANEVKDGAFNSLKEGDAVTFEMAEGQKGPNAVNVSKSGDAPASTDDDTVSEESSDDSEVSAE